MLESFRPGVLDRLGVGYERLREAQPADRLLRDHRLRPRRARTRARRPRHELPGAERPARPDRRRRTGRRSQSAGQIADLGGGGLMAAFGDPGRAARARALGRGPARRRLDDRRRALVAGDGRRPRSSATARVPRRGERDARRRGRLLPALRVPPTAGSAAARWSRSSGARFCDGVGRPDLVEHQFDGAGLGRRTREVAEVFRGRTRDEWARFNDEHDCCVEPVLDLDEALDSELVRGARDGGRGRAARARDGRACSGIPVKLSRTPATRPGRRRRSASTPTRCWARPGSPPTRSPPCSSRAPPPAPTPTADAEPFLA